MPKIKTYIINVSTNELRKKHMYDIISKNNCLSNYYFIHDGDLDMISSDILNKYFGGELEVLSPSVSCAYKHILLYFDLLKSDDNIVLVLEDDIFLDKLFCSKLENILMEINNRQLENFIISLEDSNLKYINRSRLIKNTILYKELLGRMTGAYLIDKKCANSLITEIEENKCNFPIDWFHNYCSKKGLINIYWAHPTLATQGSLNGKINSIIQDRKYPRFRTFFFSITRYCRKLVYKLR